jgi:hypothetical protein
VDWFTRPCKICDRDTKWSTPVHTRLGEAGLRVYHRERNHQGLANTLIDSAPAITGLTLIRRRFQLGGLLNYYYRAA